MEGITSQVSYFVATETVRIFFLLRNRLTYFLSGEGHDPRTDQQGEPTDAGNHEETPQTCSY